MRFLFILALLWGAGCSKVQETAPRSIVIDKGQIDIGQSAPVIEKGATNPTTHWICTLLPKRKENPGTPLLGDAGKTVEIKDGDQLLGTGRLVAGTIDRNHRVALHVSMETEDAAAKLYRELQIWPRPGQETVP